MEKEINLLTIDPEALDAADAETIKRALEKLPILKKLIARIEGRAKELLEDDEQAFGGDWVLQQGALNRTVSDPEKFLHSLLQATDEAGNYILQPKDLLQVANFPLGKVESLYKERTGLPGPKAKAQLKELVADAVEEKRRAPSLKKSA